jgi:hypothetical protein
MLFIHAALATLLQLKRRCPRCGREHIAAVQQRREPVRCEHCGAEIPPRLPPHDARDARDSHDSRGARRAR